jgi:hypothetical protein
MIKTPSTTPEDIDLMGLFGESGGTRTLDPMIKRLTPNQ